MFEFYNKNDLKLIRERRKNTDIFQDDEKYAINIETNARINNSNYDESKSDLRNKEMRNKDILQKRNLEFPTTETFIEGVYLKEKGDSTQYDKFISDYQTVLTENPILS